MGLLGHWDISTGTTFHRPAHGLWGSFEKIGLRYPIEDDGEDDTRLALRVWASLYAERRAAYDRWVRDQFSIAHAAIDNALRALRGQDPLAIVESGHMPGYLQLFGRDEYHGRVSRVAPHVDDVRGAQVMIEFETTFGGGPNWFGPPGHRYYHVYIDVEGATPWHVPPSDDGYDRLVRAVMGRRDAEYARFSAARARVEHVVRDMWDRVKDDHPRSRVQHLRAEQASERLYEQVEAIRPSPAHPFRDWAILAPIDIWPGRTALPPRRLSVLQSHYGSGGWYARLSRAA